YGLAPDGDDVRLELLRNDTPENRVAHALLSLSQLTINDQGGSQILERMEPGEARSLVASHLADPATQADATRVLDSAVTLGVIDEAEAAAIRAQTMEASIRRRGLPTSTLRSRPTTLPRSRRRWSAC
ncbi:MAG: hypothetical protein AAFY60_04210, partial [Myxococcota bacterium]